ncbi:MAG: hypothetical protein KDB88_07315 [Flavobacteriales bacterium]|nr:hypothetical protein [Flavobacteriales bacterium]
MAMLVFAGITAVYAVLQLVHSGPLRAEAFMGCDTYWYERIALEGYPHVGPGEDLGHWVGEDIHQTAWAFFPLYPLLLRSMLALTNWSSAEAMIVLSFLLALAWIPLAYALFHHERNERIAKWAVLAMLLQPFGIYFHLGMSEPLFLVGLLGSFLAVARGSALGLALMGTILVLSRPNGLFLLPGLVLYSLEQEGQGSVREILSHPVHALHKALPLVVPILAFMCYCAYQWSTTGDPLAYLSAQAGWGRRFTHPFSGFFNAGDPATQFDSWYTIILLLLVGLLAKRISLSFCWVMLIVVVMPLFSGSVASMPRFTTVLFPLFLITGEWLSRIRAPVLVLLISFIAQLFWFWAWLEGDLVTC